jgi:Sec-independent protein translocase protein TatA
MLLMKYFLTEEQLERVLLLLFVFLLIMLPLKIMPVFRGIENGMKHLKQEMKVFVRQF